MIRTTVRLALRITTLSLCFNCVYAACCGWLEAIIARFNEYVLAEVALLNCEFKEGSRQLVQLFNTTGMNIITNEVAWDVTLTVGYIIGFCVTGGIGLLLH